jgi:hypothetical protein
MTKTRTIDGTAYVYVLGPSDAPQKVGIANNPRRRLGELQNGNHLPLRLADFHAVASDQAAAVEEYAHYLLRDAHLRGEWFDTSPQAASAAIKDAIEAVRLGKRAPVIDVVGLGLRIDARIKAALDKAAADDRRSINSYVEIALEAHLQEKGYLK